MQRLFIEDPGHGWLRVPESDVANYFPGGARAVSGCSFTGRAHGRRVFYLEEDCDAPRMLAGYREAGLEVKVCTDYREDGLQGCGVRRWAGCGLSSAEVCAATAAVCR